MNRPAPAFATAQQIGTRTEQCDATATRSLPGGGRAYVLLDGIGSTPQVRDWTRAQTKRLAALCAHYGDPTRAIAGLQGEIAAERWGEDYGDHEYACAVAAVHCGDWLYVAWCGDARAYVLHDGVLKQLTKDHNMAQELRDQGKDPGRYLRNKITQHLGYWGRSSSDAVIGSTTVPAAGRLLLCSDGVYDPLEDTGEDIAVLLAAGTPGRACRSLVAGAVAAADPEHTDNATALVADLAQLLTTAA